VTGFVRYQLRTTDPAAARAFYAAVVGAAFAEQMAIVTLPAEAAARGAPAHWLGQIGVDDVERATAAFVERGATRLGPTRLLPGGGELAIVRDPQGAVVGLATAAAQALDDRVIWHQLHTTDRAAAAAGYSALFGWQLTERVDLGATGIHQNLAWDAGGVDVGSISETARLPGVHTHWLFHIGVVDLELALTAVQAAGATVMGPIDLPGGDRLAVLDDPQGAAIALRQRAPLSSARAGA
jgi:predicted enzyme related to lactoylglutathione lyase